jgi:hypothetical protein
MLLLFATPFRRPTLAVPRLLSMDCRGEDVEDETNPALFMILEFELSVVTSRPPLLERQACKVIS